MDILVDIDGVIARWDYPALLCNYLGVSPDRMPRWSPPQYSITEWLGVPEVDVDNMYRFALISGQHCAIGSTATNRLGALYREGNNILIYTSRMHYLTPTTIERWLRDKGVPHTRVVTTEDVMDGHYDAFIDDHVTKLLSVPNVRQRLLFDRPWNKGCLNVRDLFRRVHGWGEIYEILGKG